MQSTGPGREAERLEELRRHQILDTPAEPAFDELAWLASMVCGTPVALVSLVDADRQWFKARVGFEATQTPIDQSFCARTIRQDDVMIVPDAHRDPRFSANPLVVGDPGIRFYAGMPLTTSGGHNLGTLCVIDRAPRRLSGPQVEALRALGRQASAQLELRLKVAEAGRSRDELERRVEERTEELARAVADLRDEVAQRKLAEANLQHQATHDPLTGLANRALLHDHLSACIRSSRPGDSLALLLVDLDLFKEINDTFGHHFGDLILKEMNPRLREAAGADALVARLGGDEFGIVVQGVGEPEAVRIARRVADAIARPFEVDGQRLDVRGSVGVALHPDHGADPGTLLRNADVAMYGAKHRHAEVELWADALPRGGPGRLSMIADLRLGIDAGELVLDYQPKVELATGRLSGAEALVRWRHPVRGLIPPGDFIPLAERTGLIKPIDLWALKAGLGQAQTWRGQGHDVAVAVNLGTESLQDRDLANLVAHLLEETGTEPSRLTLEITESSMMADPALAMRVLGQVHDIGVRVAIDDFGTGYSSLAYLKGLPVDEVKVDQAFVKMMAIDPLDACIVRSVVDLGHNLGMKVVAEGIEDARTAEMLAALGCDYGQGFHYSRPLSPADFPIWTLGRTGPPVAGLVLPQVPRPSVRPRCDEVERRVLLDGRFAG